MIRDRIIKISLIAGLVIIIYMVIVPVSGADYSSVTDNGNLRYWIYFMDKGLFTTPDNEKSTLARSFLSARSLLRRQKYGIKIDDKDLPICDDYLAGVNNSGAIIFRKSKWLNAVSVIATKGQLQLIYSMPFVKKVEPVAVFKRAIRPAVAYTAFTPLFADSTYGLSYRQLFQLGVVQLHRLGYTGEGILISIFDTGFFIDHGAFDSLRVNDRLVAAYDFINNDTDVQDNNDIQRSHGTTTFSVISAYSPGKLIGGAFGADIALAKTELVMEEIEIEEDNWVAAAEWADSLGADIISSSLGYNDWYNYSDMDGNTAVTTVAADIAASKGILVVNSAGNEGNSQWEYIIAPADGDSVLAVGAVDSSGLRLAPSSIGPTYDGRIKPDVMAMGSRVRCALWQGEDFYGYSGGTSLAAPLAASAAALLLEAKPGLDPSEIIDSLHLYASNAGHPDNFYGWGILNTLRAGGVFRISSSSNTVFIGGEEFELTVSITGSGGPISGDSITVIVSPDSSLSIIRPFSELSPGEYSALLSSTDKQGGQFIKIYDHTREIGDSVFVNVIKPSRDYSEYFCNYPNPFKTFTDFSFYLPLPLQTDIYIYSIAGEKVREIRLETSRTSSGLNSCRWYADNNFGNKIAGGIYICVIVTSEYSAQTKALFIR